MAHERIDSKLTKHTSYIWQLPSITPLHRQLLCFGYGRTRYAHFIPPALLMLIASFHSTDSYCVRDIIHSDVGKRFHGPMISINGFKFYIEFYPNGTTKLYEGQVAAFFCLASLPPNVLSLSMDFTFRLEECDSETTTTAHVYDTVSYWKGVYSHTVKLQGANTLTFALTVGDMKVNYKNKDEGKTLPVIDRVMNPIHVIEPQHFLWEVTDTVSETVDEIQHAPNVYGFASPIFTVGGVKWYLTFYPNGSKITRATFCNVYLHLAALPKTTMKVNIRHSQGLQGDVEMRAARFITVFDRDKDSWGLIERSTYSTKDLDTLNNFLCVAEMVMLDVYDNNEVVEWNKDMHANNDISVVNTLRLCEYQWKLNDVMMSYMKEDNVKSLKCESVAFKMFGFEWKAVLYPHGIEEDQPDITICLELLSTSLPKDYTLSVRCTFDVIELNARYITTGILDEKYLVINWGNGRILTVDVQDLEECNIKISMEVVDVYCDGTCVTKEFMQSIEAQ